MKQKTRYNIQLAAKKEVIVDAEKDLKVFAELMNTTGERDQFGVHSLDYYKRAYQLFHPLGMCELFIAKYGDQPLAGIMVFRNGTRSWYFYGASSNLERNRMPAYLVQWRGIEWAIENGCDTYDLWGIPDFSEDQLEAQFSNRSDGLWGVYRFKRGFAGKLYRSAEAFDRIYQPFIYWIYQKILVSRKADGSA
jgi:lipid II:glycine glycyltransferase (peptidoglycan interpeptide bridge formation enzyme)